MDPELADQDVVGPHLGGVVGRNRNRLPGRQDIEVAGIKEEAAVAFRDHRFPEIPGRVVIDPVHVDEARMGFRPVADQGIAALPLQIDGHRDSLGDILVSGPCIDEADLLVQAAHGGVRRRRAAAAQAKLVQPGARAHHDAEGARRDLRIEGPLVSAAHPVELVGPVGDPGG